MEAAPVRGLVPVPHLGLGPAPAPAQLQLLVQDLGPGQDPEQDRLPGLMRVLVQAPVGGRDPGLEVGGDVVLDTGMAKVGAPGADPGLGRVMVKGPDMVKGRARESEGHAHHYTYREPIVIMNLVG